MIKKNDLVLLAVSGGYDSTALTLILNNLKNVLKIGLIMAHLNHGIRGKESDDDESYCVYLARSLRIRLIRGKVPIPDLKKQDKKISLEEIARRERYSFLLRTAREVKASKIATAHNADDTIENFFLAFLNGKGTSALSGIPPVNDKIVRPLIETFRSEIEDYVNQTRFQARLDTSNLNTKIPRNLIRQRIIPFIEKTYHPFKAGLLQTMGILYGEDLFLKELENSILKQIRFEKGLYRLIFPVNIKQYSIPLIQRLIRYTFDELGKGKSSYHQIMNTAQSIKKGLQSFSEDNIVYFSKDNYSIFTLKEEIKPYSLSIRAGRKIFIKPLGLRVSCEWESANDLGQKNKICLNVPENKTLVIRTKKGGDKIILMNTSYPTLLKKLFIDLKIPSCLRSLIPLVEINNEVAAVYPGIFPLNLEARINDKYKILDKRKKCIKLYFESKVS